MTKKLHVKTDILPHELVSNITRLVTDYVIENFLFGDSEGLEEVTSFQDSGIIDSTGILELVDFLEQQFSIVVADEELIPQNLDCIQNVVRFLGRKQLSM